MRGLRTVPSVINSRANPGRTSHNRIVRELFIYYRLHSSNATAAMALVQAFQARLRERHPQLIARLLSRSDETLERQTWMETYSTDPTRDGDGVSAEIESDIEAHARVLLALTDGPRRTEAFVACVS